VKNQGFSKIFLLLGEIITDPGGPKNFGSGALIVSISLFRYLQNSGENHTSQPRGSR
jgi:hypothetical protein